MKKPKLKRCPFCGKRPVSFPSGDGSGLMIQCMNADCVGPHVRYIPPSAAIAAWNARIGPQQAIANLIVAAKSHQFLVRHIMNCSVWTWDDEWRETVTDGVKKMEAILAEIEPIAPDQKP